MPRKPWDFEPEPIHKRIAAGAMEKQLLELLARPENVEDLKAILDAAKSLAAASNKFVTRVVPNHADALFFATRIAYGALRKALRRP